MTLEEAIEWCADNEVDICFFLNPKGEHKIMISLGSMPLADGCTTVIEAVEIAKIEIESVGVKSRYI